MSGFVLDASVSARWLLDLDPPSFAVSARARLTVSGDHAVPALWHWQMANSLVVSDRRAADIPGGFSVAWERFEELTRIVVTDSHGTERMPVSVDLAREHGLTAYDASYLEQAVRLRIPIITLDRQLRAAAERSGVVVDF